MDSSSFSKQLDFQDSSDSLGVVPKQEPLAKIKCTGKWFLPKPSEGYCTTSTFPQTSIPSEVPLVLTISLTAL